MNVVPFASAPSAEVVPAALPHNLDAEQALLGALLFDNAAYERLNDGLAGRHFYEPFHGRLYGALEDSIRRGQLAEPIAMAERFKTDPAFVDLGGIRYLADLVDRAPPAAHANDFGRLVYELALRRELIRLGGEIGADAANPPEPDLDAREMISQAEIKLYNLAESGAPSTGFVDFATALRGAVEMAAEAFSRDGGLAGLSTGLADLDAKLGGLHKSDLLILAGRPSMGKSGLAANIAFHIARNYAWELDASGEKKTVDGGVVAFFSLEMSAEQLAMRLVADVSGVPSDRLRKGEIDASEFARVRDAAVEVSEAPLFIDATGGISLAKLTARARRLKRQHGLDLLVVDYLQLVTASDGSRNQGRVQEVSEVTAGLKALAKELNIPVIALAQLSRKVEDREDKRPQLADLRESGSIEQDADAVMFIYREEYYLGRAEPEMGTDKHLDWQEKMDRVAGQAEVIIGKQRHGPIGTVKLAFNADLVRFGNLAREGRFD